MDKQQLKFTKQHLINLWEAAIGARVGIVQDMTLAAKWDPVWQNLN